MPCTCTCGACLWPTGWRHPTCPLLSAAEPAATGPAIVSATGSLAGATLSVTVPEEAARAAWTGSYKVYVLPLDATSGTPGPEHDLGTVAPKDAGAAGTEQDPLVFEVPLSLYRPAGDGYQARRGMRGLRSGCYPTPACAAVEVGTRLPSSRASPALLPLVRLPFCRPYLRLQRC